MKRRNDEITTDHPAYLIACESLDISTHEKSEYLLLAMQAAHAVGRESMAMQMEEITAPVIKNGSMADWRKNLTELRKRYNRDNLPPVLRDHIIKARRKRGEPV